eukprot:16041-Heterococcus_DN1.PRE.3
MSPKHYCACTTSSNSRSVRVDSSRLPTESKSDSAIITTASFAALPVVAAVLCEALTNQVSAVLTAVIVNA